MISSSGSMLPRRRRGLADGRGRSGFRIPPGQRGGAARMHRQPGADQGSGFDRRAEAGRFFAAGPRQRAAAAARHHRRPVDARQGPGGRAHGCHRRRGAPAHRAGRARPGRACAWSASPTPSSASSTTWRRCRAGAADPWYMLDNAEMCIKALADEAPRGCRIWRLRRSDAAKTVKLDHPKHAGAGAARTRAQAATHPLIEPVAPSARPVDPQFLELFIEEAKEEIASIQQSFPLWDQNPDGSGGARLPAAQLPHAEGQRADGRRALDRRVRLVHRESAEPHHRQDAVAHARHDGSAAQCGRRAAAAGRTAGERAGNPAAGRDAHVARLRVCRRPRGRAARRRLAPGGPGRQRDGRIGGRCTGNGRWRRGCGMPPQRAASPGHVRCGRGGACAPPMDPQLHEIYSKETSSHLAEIREYLRKRAGQPAPASDLPESVYRAIHTLSGSSKMAEARHGIRITEPLNHFMRKVFDSGQGFSDGGSAATGATRSAPSTTSCRTSTNRPRSSRSSRRCSAGCEELETVLDAQLGAGGQRDQRIGAGPAKPCGGSRPPPAARTGRARLRHRPRTARSAARRGVRSRDREHLQRGGDRADRGGGDLADRLESRPQGQGAGSPSCSANCTR